MHKIFSVAEGQTIVINCNSANKSCLLQVVHTKAIAALTQFCDFFCVFFVKNLPLQTPPLPLMHVSYQFPIDEQVAETKKHGFSKVSLFFQILYLKSCFVQEEAVQQFSSRMKKYKKSWLYFLVTDNK